MRRFTAVAWYLAGCVCLSLSHFHSLSLSVSFICLTVFFSLWIQSIFFSLVCVCMCVDECVWVDVNVYACVIDALLRSVLLFNRFGFGFYGPYVAFFCWQTSCANNMIELLYRLWLHVVPKLPKQKAGEWERDNKNKTHATKRKMSDKTKIKKKSNVKLSLRPSFIWLLMVASHWATFITQQIVHHIVDDCISVCARMRLCLSFFFPFSVCRLVLFCFVWFSFWLFSFLYRLSPVLVWVPLWHFRVSRYCFLLSQRQQENRKHRRNFSPFSAHTNTHSHFTFGMYVFIRFHAQ